MDRANREASIAEEGHFHKLFGEVLDYLKDEHFLDDGDIRAAVDRLISSFRYDLGHKFSDFDLTRTDNICGYLQRYAIHGAGMMRQKTLQALRHCPDLQNRLKQQKLNLVSLGCGPGNDVVGFLSALRELGPRGCQLNVTVIDAVEQWAKCVRLVKHFARVGSFGAVSEMFRDNAVEFMFLKTELPGTISDDVCHIQLEYADVILISKLISIMEWDMKKRLIEFLYHTLNESAVILLLDCPFERELWEDFELLYLSDEGQTYELHPLEYQFNPHYDELRPVTSKSRIAVLRT